MKDLTQILGPQWAEKYVIPKVIAFQKEQNYIFRLTTLFAASALVSVLTTDIIKKHILPMLIALSTDKVPNIRMNVAKTIKNASGIAKEVDLAVSLYQ